MTVFLSRLLRIHKKALTTVVCALRRENKDEDSCD